MNPYKNITLYFWICLLSAVGLIINRMYLGNFGFRFDPLDLFLSTLFIISQFEWREEKKKKKEVEKKKEEEEEEEERRRKKKKKLYGKTDFYYYY